MNLLDYFENLSAENKLTQAFLIGNVIFDDVKSEINTILQKYIFDNNINNMNDNPDVYILRQDVSSITKDNIKELLNKLSTTSQFNNKKVYIIDKTEYLSDTVYNAILKTLEEPKKGIYAFLITNNIDAVKPTIISRCQKLFISASSDKIELHEELETNAFELIKSIEVEKIKTIAKKYKIYSIISDRDVFIQILRIMLTNYYNALKIKINKDKYNSEICKIIIDNNTNENIMNKILIIDKSINLLSNYLNKNLCIDRFIIEMWRCTL